MTKREKRYHEKNRTLRTFKAFLDIVKKRTDARLYEAAVEAVYYGGSAVDRLPVVGHVGHDYVKDNPAASALGGIRTAIKYGSVQQPAQGRTFISANLYEAIQKRPSIVEEAIKETARHIVNGTDPNT